MKRVSLMLVAVSAFMLTVAAPAFAVAGDPPVFNASTLTPIMNDFGTALLAAIVTLIGVVLVIRVPFAAVRLGLQAVRKLFGSSRPTAA